MLNRHHIMRSSLAGEDCYPRVGALTGRISRSAVQIRCSAASKPPKAQKSCWPASWQLSKNGRSKSWGRGFPMRILKPIVAVLALLLANPAALSQGVPDLSGLDPQTRELIENACYTERFGGVPADYAACVRKRLSELESSGGVPDLSGLGPQTRELIDNACVTERFRGGPAAYAACVRKQLSELRSSGGVPDLSGLDPKEREPIENACMTERYRGGPAAYTACLSEQLTSIGIEPGAMPRERYAPPPDTKPRASPNQEPPEPKQRPPEKHVQPNAEVQTAQALLQTLGYDPGPVDGQMGPRTREAIMAFQRDHGFEADGRLNIFLLIVMEAERLRRQDPSLAGAGGRGPKFAAIPPFDWPAWTRVSDRMPTSNQATQYGPADLFEAVKRHVWVVVAGRSKQELERGGDLSQGSAIVISRKLLLTNCHVVDGRGHIIIVQSTVVKEARLASADPSTDRCVLAVAEPTLTPVRGVRRFSQVRVGERVFTVGTPIGLEQTLGEGIVSGLRTLDQVRLVQTTAPISPGSSGGGLFDGSGNLIGITTSSFEGAQAINFAIAAEDYWR